MLRIQQQHPDKDATTQGHDIDTTEADGHCQYHHAHIGDQFMGIKPDMSIACGTMVAWDYVLHGHGVTDGA
jgi:hypothetical protein